MSVHQVHPRSTFQKQFRTRSLRQQKAKHNFPSSPCRGSAQRVRAEAPCRDSMPRHTLFCRIPCIVDRKLPVCSGSVQRYTFSRGKTCIATAGYRKNRSTMQRHTLFCRIPCIADGKLLPTPKQTPHPPKTNTPRLHGTPQKMSARIGNDRCRHFLSDGP